MAHRQKLEAELKHYRMISTQIADHLKSTVATLIAERDRLKEQEIEHLTKIAQMDRENIQLKTLNEENQKQLEYFRKQSIAAHEANLMGKSVIDVAQRIFGAGSEFGSTHHTPIQPNSDPNEELGMDHADVEPVLEVSHEVNNPNDTSNAEIADGLVDEHQKATESF